MFIKLINLFTFTIIILFLAYKLNGLGVNDISIVNGLLDLFLFKDKVGVEK